MRNYAKNIKSWVVQYFLGKAADGTLFSMYCAIWAPGPYI